mgnify:FL=1
MIDAIWFVTLVMVIPALIMWVLSVVLESRPKVRGARRMTDHEWAIKWQRREWERRKRERV